MSYDMLANLLQSPHEVMVLLGGEPTTPSVGSSTGSEGPSALPPMFEDTANQEESPLTAVFLGGDDADSVPNFPSLLPVTTMQYRLAHDHADSDQHPLSMAKLTGRTPKQYVEALGRSPRSRMARFRKQLRKLGTPTIATEVMLSCHFLGRSRNRQEVREAYLEGEHVPVIEYEILDTWMRLHGVEKGASEEVMPEGRELTGKRLASRVREHARYRDLLLPVLDAVQRVTPEEEAAPTAHTWATLNAWFAVASLYDSIRILADFRCLWPRGYDLLAQIAQDAHADSRLIKAKRIVPAIQTRSLESLHHLQRTGYRLVSADSLLMDTTNLLAALKTLPEHIAIEETDHVKLISAQQRSLLQEWYTVTASEDDEDTAHPSAVRRLVASMDELGAEHADELEPIKARLRECQDKLDGCMQGLEADPRALLYDTEHDDPDQQGGMFSEGAVIPETLLFWLQDIHKTLVLMEEGQADFAEKLARAMADDTRPPAAKMAQVAKCSQQYESWVGTVKKHLERIANKAAEAVPDTLELVVFTVDAPEDEEEQAVAEDPAALQLTVAELREELDSAYTNLAAARQQSQALSHHIEQIDKGQRDGARPGAETTESAEAVRAALLDFAAQNTASQALRLVEQAYPTRLRVLESAMDSALDADSQLSPSGVLRKVLCLATEGWDILNDDRPPYELTQVIPGEVSLGESDSVAKDARLRQQRRFTEKTAEGRQDWQMYWHLRLDRCNRLYFAWDAEARQVVIGHAGAHLSIASTS